MLGTDCFPQRRYSYNGAVLGFLMALRFADVPVGRHARAYWRHVLALVAGLALIIAIPELSLFLPRSAGMIR